MKNLLTISGQSCNLRVFDLRGSRENDSFRYQTNKRQQCHSALAELPSTAGIVPLLINVGRGFFFASIPVIRACPEQSSNLIFGKQRTLAQQLKKHQARKKRTIKGLILRVISGKRHREIVKGSDTRNLRLYRTEKENAPLKAKDRHIGSSRKLHGKENRECERDAGGDCDIKAPVRCGVVCNFLGCPDRVRGKERNL